MSLKVLITGSTDGIGLEAAKMIASQGHHIILHGRDPSKVEHAAQQMSELSNKNNIEHHVADLSNLEEVKQLASTIDAHHSQLDILINNAGVYKTHDTSTHYGIDIRFIVNTIAPYLLTRKLLPLFNHKGRIINLSSAAQAPVDLNALTGNQHIDDDFSAYAQSKLALTMWSRYLALSFNEKGPMIVSVNPGSLLATKMVKDGFGVAGKDINIGAEILARLALSDDFVSASGLYFDNDSGQFSDPHPDALDPQKNTSLVQTIDTILDSVQANEADTKKLTDVTRK